MIRIRTAKRVPKNAVNLAYIHSPGFTVGGNLSLMDTSYTRPENVCAYGGDVAVDTGIDNRVDTQDIHISSRSVLHQKVYRPIPLYYRYRIGRGLYFVLCHDGDPGDLSKTRDEIRKILTILDRDDNPLDLFGWDIDVVATDGGTGYTVDLYLNRRQRPDETFKVKYDAKGAGTTLPNHVEVINSVEYMVQGVDYTLTELANGYAIAGLLAANYAPGIGIFYRGGLAAGGVRVGVAPVQIGLKDDSGTYHYVPYTNLTVNELVAALNGLGLSEYLVVPQSEADSIRFTVGDTAISKYGTVLLLHQMIHVRYNEESRIRTLKPHAGPTSTPWYLRVDPGEFLQDGQIGVADVKFQFAVPEYDNQTWSYTYGQPWRDFSNDLADVLDDRVLQVHRAPIRDGSLVLYSGDRDVSSKVRDIDLLNGVVFLTSQIRDEIVADYSYEERTFVYTNIDLNTNSLHNPNIFGKYIGVYATPHKILSANPALRQTFTGCVRHVVRDTYAEVVSQVDGVLFDDGSDPKAFLLGVFRPVLSSDPDDVKIVDTRTRGGGITDDISKTAEPESDFFWDCGRWGGQPFQDKGSLVVSVPEEIFGTGKASIRMSIPVPPTGYVTPTGLLTREFVQGTVDRHIAAGHLALIWPRTNVPHSG